jgi:FkbM family methyltransferase
MNFKSQAGEDIFLFNTFFKNKKKGKYIELGAMNGINYSNTYFFEKELEWTGILIEPNAFNFNLLKNNRPNNYLFNDVISDRTEEVSFRYFNNHAAMSGVSGIEDTLPVTHLSQFFDTEKYCNEIVHNNTNSNCICWYKKQQLQGRSTLIPKSLTHIINNTNIDEFDFLSLDVEGHEYEVLKSWDFSVPINVILIEMLGVNPDKEDKCRSILIDHNYQFFSHCAHNEVYTLNK